MPAPRSLDLLQAARNGDHVAFGQLVEPWRADLQAHCYRMLGSADDAEETLQEVMLKAWRGIGGFEGRSSLKSWLYQIATNACLNVIRSRKRRVLPADVCGPGPTEAVGEHPLWIEPYPDQLLASAHQVAGPECRYEQQESVELAFVAALQHLPARQRAVLIFRDVLAFSAEEAADVLATTPTAVNSALAHARRSIAERLPDPSQQVTLRALGDRRLAEIVTSYRQAMENGDIAAIRNLLTEDVTWSMPPTPQWFAGQEQVLGFVVAHPFTLRWRSRLTAANGQPAIGWYRYQPDAADFHAEVLEVLSLKGSQISAVTAFIGGERFGQFGLPATIA